MILRRTVDSREPSGPRSSCNAPQTAPRQAAPRLVPRSQASHHEPHRKWHSTGREESSPRCDGRLAPVYTHCPRLRTVSWSGKSLEEKRPAQRTRQLEGQDPIRVEWSCGQDIKRSRRECILRSLWRPTGVRTRLVLRYPVLFSFDLLPPPLTAYKYPIISRH